MAEHEHEQRLKEKRQQWAEHIRNWSESGKSQKQYCKERGLKLYLFYYWNRKFKEKRKAQVRLVPVGMHPIKVHQSESTTSLVLILKQYKVEICTGFDSATLGRVIQVLEQA
jgi:hypothetical protein